MLLDGQPYDAPATEKPQVGTTEDWVIVNPTMNSHPIHLHLVQFQLVERQTIASTQYMYDWETLNGNLPLNQTAKNLDLNRYLEGQPTKPTPNEQCWKDTIQADAGMVTVIRVRFAPQDGSSYEFDPTSGPGYVWHCHILEHEDNSMMRPLIIVGSNIQISLPLVFAIVAGVVIVAVAALIVLKRFRWTKANNRVRQQNLFLFCCFVCVGDAASHIALKSRKIFIINGEKF